ncbi:leucine-rich repeat-containing protein 49 isoform X3 [Cryptotermes secundus]|uniref:leucine-rich repeat-containing protein 49 isoform X3 n=1 Tax=Cryptotermes secundus TaxID=105785 RepID=UPI000CD7C2B0|nr:leucine-rich repeat-containing protein 49 isoform X3 [Cryptotermes secundus]
MQRSSAVCSSTGAVLPTSGVLLQTGPSGRIQALRSQKEKERNPDRICLDRRGLSKLPMLIGETRVRLLSLQHNLITRLDGVPTQGLTKLIFLDIYDNQLERITGLDSLENLRVLLVGKNRIRRIEGLNSVTKLEVLDLHGNQITQVSGLSALSELKVLNLAGNQIRIVGSSDLEGLQSLQELNLRRNRIKRLLGFAETPRLQKLFLSNNELHTVDNMSSIVKASQLSEITVDGNPVSLGGDCVSFLVSYLPNLKLLSCMEVTESVRKAALVWRDSKEALTHMSQHGAKEMCTDVRREKVISNARTNWELLRSQTQCSTSTSLSSSLKDLHSDKSFEVPNERHVQSDSGVSSVASSISTNPYRPVANVGKRLRSARPALLNASEKKRSSYASRSASQESNTSQQTASSATASIDFFRLPPILTPLLTDWKSPQEIGESHVNEGTAQCDAMRRCDSLSSVEPNVDSSLSSLPSDSGSSSDTNNVSSSSEHSELESSEEPASPHEVAKGNNKVPRNVKSAIHYRKNVPRRAQTRAATGRVQHKPSMHQGRVREQGGDFLVEICGRCLNIYGQGALRFIDRPWNSGKAADVNTVKFNYINFNNIIPVLGRIKQRFPNVEHFLFRETNIHYVGQLNALADIQGLTSLCIESDGNPITCKEWQKYTIYRLSHWGLRIINGVEISDEQVAAACAEFQGLSDIVLCSLPDVLLQPLLGRLHLEGSRFMSPQQQPVNAKQWLWSADPALRSVVAKEALQWHRGTLCQEDMMWRHKGRSHLSSLIEVACAAVEKLKLLEHEWPAILAELVQETLVDYSHLDSYMKKCMQSLRM